MTFDVGFRGLQWVMGRIERDVHQKRLVGGNAFVDEFDGEIRNRMRGIEGTPIKRFGYIIMFTVIAKRIISNEKVSGAR